MSDAASLETASYATWTADVSEQIAGWHLTATAGVSRRVNSARAIGEATVDEATRTLLVDWFETHSLPLIVRETPLMAAATSKAVRSDWGLEVVDETVVMENRSAVSDAQGVRTVSIRNAVFQRELAALNNVSGEKAETLERIYARAAKKGAGLWIPGKAVGVVVRHVDAAAVFSVAVDGAHQGRGLGRRIMSAASTWAAKTGVRDVFVQVLGTNAPAVGLYSKLGYSEVYRYRYLR